MQLTSLTQARLAYAGMFVGLYVAIEPLTLQRGYGTAVALDVALSSGALAGLAGALLAATLFAMFFGDRLWDVVFWVLPVTVPLGLSLSLLERWIEVFVLQPLLYAGLGTLIAGVVGYWLDLLWCARGRCVPCCTEHSAQQEKRS